MTKKGLIDRIWDFFASIKLAIVVFSVICVLSIFGTVIEQNVDAEKNIKLLTRLFGSDFAPDIYRLIHAVGLDSMYKSWWFISLLFLFATNLIVCSIERLPSIIKIVKEPIKPVGEDVIQSMPIKISRTVDKKVADCTDLLSNALKKSGFNPQEYKNSDSIQLIAEKGRYGRLGVYITHISIIVLFLGVLIGTFKGFNGYLNLLEGTSSSVVYLPNGKEIPLDFEIRCDDFEVTFYQGTDTPKSYKSLITILENGKEVLKKEIGVNSPLKYKGITFYQSSYGFSPTVNSVFRLNVKTEKDKVVMIEALFNERFNLPNSNITVKISDFAPALGMDESGRLFNYADSMNNPAVMLEFFEGNRLIDRQWILKRYPQTWQTKFATIEFVDLWGSQYTGLQVRKDPGVWLVYLACLLMTIGLFMSFFLNHQKVWVLIRQKGNKSEVIVGANSNKYKASLENKMINILAFTDLRDNMTRSN
ncbi:MAG: cytochrome c biogenesis protein ResB [Thermodesulfovibrionales bacterium]|nr:cytochrome c biogenesis protein ResB [Thermodesulfovibrionales bacterium]